FIPLLDDEGTPQATLVALGQWSELSAQLPVAEPPSVQRKQTHGNLLTAIRSRWQNLDDLHSLIGTSSAIELAMARAQLAIAHPCGVLVTGPVGTLKTNVVRGLFSGRLKRAGLPKMAGQLFPIDCRVAEPEQIEDMLEMFASRLNPDTPRQSQMLLLEHIDQLSETAVAPLKHWLETTSSQCLPAATSVCRADELATRGPAWAHLLARLSTMEVIIPPLSQRRQDIAPVAMHLLAVTCQKKQRAQLGITPEAIQLITAFPWPENHWQLSQAIDEAVGRAVLVANIQVGHLPVAVRSYSSTNEQLEFGSIEPIDLDKVLLQCERIMLSRALKLSPRNRAHAARLLGISRPRLLRRIEQLGLDQADDEPST
ncbi:MAG: helix-turn-helix domain-containing protein, partial [Aureliella sp.]